jgi:hypothetical protein
MEGPVVGNEIVLGGFRRQITKAVQLLKVGIQSHFRGFDGAGLLDDGTKLQQLARIVDRDRRNAVTAARQDAHQALHLQPKQRIAHRGLADVEALGEVAFAQLRAGRQSARDNVCAQAPIDFVARKLVHQ